MTTSADTSWVKASTSSVMTCAPRRPPYRRRRAHRRRVRRQVAHRRVRHPVALELLRGDVLARAQPGVLLRSAGIAGLLGGAVLTHALLLLLVGSITAMVTRGGRRDQVEPQRLQVSLVEKQPTLAAPVARTSPRDGPHVVQSRLRPRVIAPPPPDPMSVPPPEPPPGAAVPRRIVGLSFESTVSGGSGPAYAVGNTRMGETARVAEDPANIDPNADTASERLAARIAGASGRWVAPRKLETVTPTYPPALEEQGIEGKVVLLVDIGADGRVTDVKVVESSGEAAFDAAAVAGARRELYRPAEREGTPVPARIRFTVHFRLTQY